VRYTCKRKLSMARNRDRHSVLGHLMLTVVMIAILTSSGAVLGQSATPTLSDYRSDETAGFIGTYSDLYGDMDKYWRREFSMIGIRYVSPTVVEVRSRHSSGCGTVYPWEENAYYCQLSQEIILFPAFMAGKEQQIGDYAPIVILAHEWAHHAQYLASVPDYGGNAYELQADCLAGVFSRYAETQGWLDRGDVIEALTLAESMGDNPLLPQDSPGAHGTYDQRRDAVMRGMLDGLPGCNFPDSGSLRPTQIPTRTAPTPIPTRVPPTPTPIVENWPTGPLPSPRLPVTLPLAHARCFSVVGEGSLTFSQLLDRFPGAPMAETLLREWGWQASAFRQFGCYGPPLGEAGWIEVTVHGFGSAKAAREAVAFFAAVRLDGSPLRYADVPVVGDAAVALTGPATNGTEFTIYASKGPWLVRVTGVSPSGGPPVTNVVRVAEDVLNAQQNGGGDVSGPQRRDPDLPPLRPSSTYLPSAPAVQHVDCFRTQGSGPNRYQDVVAAFVRTGAGPGAVETYGWYDGAWIIFKCAGPPPGRAKQIDVSIHQFRDAAAARQVASIVEDFQIPSANESRDCSVVRTLVICVTGYSDRGKPAADVRFVLNQVEAIAR
jgi:predicted metalloprotease